ncbi:hypothetical protein AOA80_02920 [Methanomassiliicoccales archaeon RumEn M1]|jgi:GNAT superfamily N-acetyltransferase|nr:hypothetical protein AOA80_02920 [Methanomassiliicoccales archaeon RumEn M1]
MTVTLQSCQDPPAGEVRSYRPGDEVRIVDFLESQTTWPAAAIDAPKVDHWRWKFLSNPAGPEMVCMIENGGEIVSYCASIPVRMSVGGREMLAAQGVDLCTHPDHRGKGLMGILLDHRDRMKAERGVAFDYGFPNELSYHVSTKRQGFREVDMSMMQHRFIIDRDGFFRKVNMGGLKRLGYSSYVALQRAIHRPGGSDLSVQDVERFSEKDDQLYRRALPDFDIIAVRDHRFLNWRYRDPRGGSYIVRGIREDDELLGYAVLKLESERQLIIVDMLADPRRPEAVLLLLLDAVERGRLNGSESVICTLPKGHRYERHLREMGFISEPRMTGGVPMRMIWFPRGSQQLDALSSPGPACHIMLGDTDWV